MLVKYTNADVVTSEVLLLFGVSFNNTTETWIHQILLLFICPVVYWFKLKKLHY